LIPNESELPYQWYRGFSTKHFYKVIRYLDTYKYYFETIFIYFFFRCQVKFNDIIYGHIVPICALYKIYCKIIITNNSFNILKHFLTNRLFLTLQFESFYFGISCVFIILFIINQKINGTLWYPTFALP